MDSVLLQIGERFDQMRKAQGLTQADLAVRLGVTQQAVAKHLKGHGLDLGTIGNIAEALGSSLLEIIQFFTAEKPKTPSDAIIQDVVAVVSKWDESKLRMLLAFVRSATEGFADPAVPTSQKRKLKA